MLGWPRQQHQLFLSPQLLLQRTHYSSCLLLILANLMGSTLLKRPQARRISAWRRVALRRTDNSRATLPHPAQPVQTVRSALCLGPTCSREDDRSALRTQKARLCFLFVPRDRLWIATGYHNENIYSRETDRMTTGEGSRLLRVDTQGDTQRFQELVTTEDGSGGY
jgi:hypothetical protein